MSDFSRKATLPSPDIEKGGRDVQAPLSTEYVDEKGSDTAMGEDDKDAEFGGTEARRKLEKKLLLKVDLRMSILVLIYILNYVRSFHILLTLDGV